METFDREYELSWARDYLTSKYASETANKRIMAGEDANTVLASITLSLKGAFEVEDRSYWSPDLAEFVDLATLTDGLNVLCLAFRSAIIKKR
jgi:hypothetical protein